MAGMNSDLKKRLYDLVNMINGVVDSHYDEVSVIDLDIDGDASTLLDSLQMGRFSIESALGHYDDDED
jgi:hypothetical protein